MRFGLYSVIVLVSLCGAQTVEDPAVSRAKAELAKVEELERAGVLPKVRVEQARDAVADAEEDSTIRTTLYARDISVEQANAMVDLTARRVARRKKVVDQRAEWVATGIIAMTEQTASVEAFGEAQREYKWAVDRVKLVEELAELAKTEQEAMRQLDINSPLVMVEHFVGSNKFELREFPGVDKAFAKRFHRELPVSAMGETEVHRSLNFDHRNRVDVALMPDQPDGVWLRSYLTVHKIPFFAFRGAVSGKATGAHIHIGPPSLRLLAQKSAHPAT